MNTQTFDRFDRINDLLPPVKAPRKTSTKASRIAQAEASVAVLSVDQCCRAHTAFTSLDELVADSLRTGYRPSLYTTARSTSVVALTRAMLAEKIANAFDAALEAHGSPNRAWRGSK